MSVPQILVLPEIALEKILSFLSYGEIAKNRLVCTKFNQIGGKLLTRGFLLVKKRHAAVHKRMKSMLPRRESERSTHSLASHFDILSDVETHLGMLTMTYIEYMESNMCCFIPGKVIDEIERILSLVKHAHPPRTYELLQELHDISTMAMEHFDEVILPRLEQKVVPATLISVGPSAYKSVSVGPSAYKSQKLLNKVERQAKRNKHQIAAIKEHLNKFRAKYKRQTKLMQEKTAKMREQKRRLQEQATEIQEQEATIADLKKHVEEWDQKFSDLTAELVRVREDLPKHGVPAEAERKRKSNLLSDTPNKMPKIGSEDI